MMPHRYRRRRRLPWIALATALVSAGVLVAAGGSSGGLAVASLLVLAGAFSALAYALPRFTFEPDGRLRALRTSLRRDEVRACHYFRVLPRGRAASLRVLGLYRAVPPGGRWLDVPPDLTIPTTGWSAQERRRLFGDLTAWLQAAGVSMDPATAARLDSLTR
jgi:hypothetical protein